METKSIMYNPKLLIQHLLEKKNWVFLTSLILLIVVIVMPLLLETSISEGFIVFGVMVVFVVTLINSFIDFNYLHDSKKFGYFMSKPMNHVQKLHVILASNITFAGFFMALLFILSLVVGVESQQIFLTSISLLLILIFLSAMSSYLCGNTIFAGLSTGFNFILPLFVYAILEFSVSLVTSVTQPYNMRLIMDYFMSKYYKLEVIYFIDFGDNFSLLYLIYLALLLLGIYSVTRYLIVKRENEKIGQFVIFRSFERFIAVMFSLVMPFIFTGVMPSDSFVLKIIAYVLLGSLTYYVASIVLEKSFKLSRKSYRVLLVYMTIFLCMIFVISYSIKTLKDEVPNVEDIQSVIITDSTWFYNGKESISILDLDSKIYDEYKVVSYDSRESIEAVLKIHQWILEEKDSGFYSTVNIIYEYKDGSYDKNFYVIQPTNQGFDLALYEEGMFELLRSEEFKEIKFPFAFETGYADQYVGGLLTYYQDESSASIALDQSMINALRNALKNDINTQINSKDSIDVSRPIWDNYTQVFDDYYKYESKSSLAYITVYKGRNTEVRLDILTDFIETRAVLLEIFGE